MNEPRPKTELAVRLFPALLTTFLVLWLGTASGEPRLLPVFRWEDKLLHFLAFGIVMGSHFWALDYLLPRRWGQSALILAVGSATSLGAALEVVQYYLPHRSAEWGDLLADLLGACSMGLVCAALAVRPKDEAGGDVA